MNSRMPAGERRELVLQAATRAFAAGGYAGTSTDAVAKEAGVSQPYVVRMFGTGRKVWRGSGTFDLGVDVTPSEHVALTIAWEVYRGAFAEARQALVLGFCYKHGLFAAEGADDSSMTDEARARAARALALAEALPEVDGPNRRLKWAGGVAGTSRRCRAGWRASAPP